MIQVAGGPPAPLVVEKQDEFAEPASDTSLVFERDANGAVTKLVLNTSGQELSCPKRK